MKLLAKNIRQLGTKMLFVATLLIAAACNDAIYDYEGDCSVSHRLILSYEDMAFVDIFSREVNSINLYAFNQEGVLVWKKFEKGEILKADDYAIELDLPAGKYDLIAWCGLDNDENSSDSFEESFTVPEMQEGISTKDMLTCSLNRKYTADGQAYTDEALYSLFHGSLTVEITDEEYDWETDPESGVRRIEMPLVKNTNHVRVIMQHLSGEDLNVEDFSFTIEDNNGLMNYDNSLMDDEKIMYRHWNAFEGSAGVETEDSDQPNVRSVDKVNVAIADLTVGRMMESHDMRLTITNVKDNRVVARIPLIDYALLIKENYGQNISNQEYLDRQDEFALTFFLDDSGNWLNASIIINSWRVVINDTVLDSED